MWETALTLIRRVWPAKKLQVQETPCEKQQRIEPAIDAADAPAAALAVDGGSNNLQVAHALGDVTHSTTNIYQFYGISTSGTEVIAQPVVANDKPARKPVTDEQKEILSLMDPLDEQARFRVVEFMRREFKTGMVIYLEPREVHRVRKYLDVVLGDSRNIKRQHAGRTTAA